MSKIANIYVRIKPETKKQAEKILESLGLSSSVAINMFYKQIILNQGIPFDLKIKNSIPVVSKMTEKELTYELEKGIKNSEKGNLVSADKVFQKIEEKYELWLWNRIYFKINFGFRKYF